MIRRSLALALGCAALSSPVFAESQPAQATPAAFTVSDAKADPDTWRAVDAENLIVFETTKGRIVIEMMPDVAPNHVAHFRSVVRTGLYRGTLFHRVIDGFMAQGGDIELIKPGASDAIPSVKREFTFGRDVNKMPLDATIGDADNATQGYYKGFPINTHAKWVAEMRGDNISESWVPHCPGIVSTARTDDPDSGKDQFFLMRNHYPSLDKKYTAWGRILEGQDVVMSLKTGQPVRSPDVLLKADMAADMPANTRPTAWVMRTDSSAFRNSLAAVGENIGVCDLTPVLAVVEN